MKKYFSAFAIVCLAISPTLAAWDMFGVIGKGEGEVRYQSNVKYMSRNMVRWPFPSDEGYVFDENALRHGVLYPVNEAAWGSKFSIRFSPMENLELFATDQIRYLYGSQYAVGARYALIPDMLSVFLNVGIPSGVDFGGNDCFGFIPGVQFHTAFSDRITFGSLLALGFDTDYPVSGKTGESGVLLNLGLEVELRVAFNDNFGAFAGTGLEYLAMNWEYADYEDGDWNYAKAVNPYLGVYFSAGRFTVSTSLGFDFAAVKTNYDPVLAYIDPEYKPTYEDDKIALKGNIGVSVKF